MTRSSVSLYSDSTKLCSKKDCHLAGIPQPIANFNPNLAMKCGLKSQCKDCDRRNKKRWEQNHPEAVAAAKERKRIDPKNKLRCAEYRSRPGKSAEAIRRSKEWAKNNKPRIREQSVKKRFKRFGTTEQWYHDTLKTQHGGCAICGCPPPSNRKLSIDHNHDCCGYIRACNKCRRGLLCGKCNWKLGVVEDTRFIAKALKYLERFPLITSQIS